MCVCVIKYTSAWGLSGPQIKNRKQNFNKSSLIPTDKVTVTFNTVQTKLISNNAHKHTHSGNVKYANTHGLKYLYCLNEAY